jgi:hypothetical protein
MGTAGAAVAAGVMKVRRRRSPGVWRRRGIGVQRRGPGVRRGRGLGVRRRRAVDGGGSGGVGV